MLGQLLHFPVNLVVQHAEYISHARKEFTCATRVVVNVIVEPEDIRVIVYVIYQFVCFFHLLFSD